LCLVSQQCVSGVCVTPCNSFSQCPSGQTCTSGSCVPNYCSPVLPCPPNYTCTNTQTCLPNSQVCGNSVCSEN
jgi:hypothetical protein